MRIFEFLWDNGKLSLEMLGFFAFLIGFIEAKKQLKLWENIRERVHIIAAGVLFILLVVFSKVYRDSLKKDDA